MSATTKRPTSKRAIQTGLTPSRAFHAMRDGRKPILDQTIPSDAAIIGMIENMEDNGMLSAPGEVFYRDFGWKETLTPEQAMRVNSYTGVQPLTWDITRLQNEAVTILGPYHERLTVIGADPFMRSSLLGKSLNNIGPALILPGNFLEAEALVRIMEARAKHWNYSPLLVYNPGGFWDPILKGPGSNFTTKELRDRKIHVCETPFSLRAAAKLYLAHAPKRQRAPQSTGAFEVTAGASVAMSSNHHKKRDLNARLFGENNADVRFHFVGDLILALTNAEEDQATGAGNAFQKVVETLRLYHGRKMLSRIEGHDPESAMSMTSDVTAECLQPNLADHPMLAKYKHLLQPGQNFPGSEMAKVEKATNMDTLMYDIHSAFDEIEAREGQVDRRIRFQAVLYVFPLSQDLPANPTEKNIKFVTVAGAQTYLLRKQARPFTFAGNDLDSYLSFENQPNVSVDQIQRRDGRMHPDTHYSRAYQALAHAVSIPQRAIAMPYVTKPVETATVVTDRHFIGTWTNSHDAFTTSALFGFASKGYRFADAWKGGSDFAAIEPFRNEGQAYVTLPYDYENPTNSVEKLREKIDRLLFFAVRNTDDELSDPFMRGRPHILMDRDLQRLQAHSFRLGLTGKFPLLGASWNKQSDNLADAINTTWQPSEFVADPHIPQWTSSPIVPESPKANNMAALGSAKTWHTEKKAGSRRLTRLFHQQGWGVRDGYGGEGDMDEFAQAAVDLYNEGMRDHWRFGVTTPLASIEKEPKGLRGTHLAGHFATVRTMYDRVPKIITPDVSVGVARSGGFGTLSEALYMMQDNLKGANRLVILDNERLPFRNKMVEPYTALLTLFTPWELTRMNVVVCAGPDADFAAAEEFTKNKKAVSPSLVNRVAMR